MPDASPTNPLRILLLWPYGVVGAESIPMSFSFLAPPLRDIANGSAWVGLLDCSLFNLHPASQQFIQALRDLNPDVVAISCWSQNWRWVQITIQNIREILPSTVIVLGGPHITATGTVGGGDYALMGECEHTFRQLIECLIAGQITTHIQGIRFPGLPVGETPPALVKDLDGLGLPDFEIMGLRAYQKGAYRYRSGVKLQAPILATRGCPYTCSFCEAPILSGRKIRKHSIEYLHDLILHLRRNYDVTHINIVDDNFTFYKDYAKSFCEMVLSNQDKFSDMTFATPNGIRVERSDAEMFKMMKAAGWDRVIFAPESGSQRMVDIMAKHLDLGVVAGKVEEAHAAGLDVEAFLILNYPGETDADVDETEQFLKTVPFDALSLHLFKPLPHTPIWRELVDTGKLPADYVVGRYDQVDWLANGRRREDIQKMARRYQEASGLLPHMG